MSLARRQTCSIAAPRSREASARAEIPRNTSGLVAFAVTMVRPETSWSRSRAIVSVSGSSGTPSQLAPADVGAELLAVELDARGELLARALRVVEGIADTR